jgi:O-antigen ligase
MKFRVAYALIPLAASVDLVLCAVAARTEGIALFAIAAVISPIAIYLACLFPEVMYATFLTAGTFKADRTLAFVIPQSIDLTLLFGTLTVVGASYSVVRNWSTLAYPPRLLVLPYLLFTIWAACTLTFTISPIYGADKFLRFATITSLALFAPFVLPRSIAVFQRLFSTFVLLAVAMVIDVLAGGVRPGSFELRGAFGSDYLELGRAVGMGLLIVMLFFLVRQMYLRKQGKRWMLVFYAALSAFLGAGLFLGGGRGPLLATVVTTAFMFINVSVNVVGNVPFPSRHSMHVPLTTMLLVILITAGLTAFAANTYRSYFAATWARFDVFFTSGGSSVAERARRFDTAAAIATTWPTSVTGVGIGGFTTAYGRYDARRGEYPHNVFLEIGSELGALGTFALTWMLVWSFRQWSATKRAGQIDLLFIGYTLFAMFIFQLFNASVSGDINDNRLLFACIGLIGAYTAMSRGLESAHSRGWRRVRL